MVPEWGSSLKTSRVSVPHSARAECFISTLGPDDEAFPQSDVRRDGWCQSVQWGLLGSVVAWKLCRAVAVCGVGGLGGEHFRLCLPMVFWDPFKSTAVTG